MHPLTQYHNLQLKIQGRLGRDGWMSTHHALPFQLVIVRKSPLTTEWRTPEHEVLVSEREE